MFFFFTTGTRKIPEFRIENTNPVHSMKQTAKQDSNDKDLLY